MQYNNIRPLYKSNFNMMSYNIILIFVDNQNYTFYNNYNNYHIINDLR